MEVSKCSICLNENRKVYNLNSLAEEHLGKQKEDIEIRKYCEEKGWKGSPKAHLWKMPPSIVAPYAKADTALPIAIFKKQKKKLIALAKSKGCDGWTAFVRLLAYAKEVSIKT